MKTIFTVVGRVEPYPNVEVDLDSVPQEGDTVTLEDLEPDYQTVRTVVWYPQGDPETGAIDEPFVYIVLGSRRP